MDSSKAGGIKCWIAPSILSADFSKLGFEGKRMVELGADCLHVDVMDGHFVPNLTLGAPVLKSVSSALKGVFMDVHLMVTNPEAYVQPFAAAGAHRFTFHIEATKDAPALVTSIKKAGMLAGVALKPATPVTEIEHIVQDVDLVLIMTVEPGFGGQSFMSAPLGKVRELRSRFPQLNIEVDGGVGLNTIDQCSEAGANVIVAGSSIFGSDDPGGVISKLRASVDSKLKAV